MKKPVKRLRRATKKPKPKPKRTAPQPKRKATKKPTTLQLLREITKITVDNSRAINEMRALFSKRSKPERGAARSPVANPRARPSSKAKLTRAEAVAKAREYVLGPILKDFRQGKIGEEDVAQMEERRADLIADTVREMLTGPRPPAKCTDCDKLSTTVMSGEPYCSAHARDHKQDYQG